MRELVNNKAAIINILHMFEKIEQNEDKARCSIYFKTLNF